MTAVGRLTREPIEGAALLREIARPAHGALLLFLGVVREVNDGRDVTGIEYSAYEAMAAAELSMPSTALAPAFAACSANPPVKQ